MPEKNQPLFPYTEAKLASQAVNSQARFNVLGSLILVIFILLFFPLVNVDKRFIDALIVRGIWSIMIKLALWPRLSLIDDKIGALRSNEPTGATGQETVGQDEVFAPLIHRVPRQVHCRDHKFVESWPKSDSQQLMQLTLGEIEPHAVPTRYATGPW